MDLKNGRTHQTCCQCGVEKSHWSVPTGVAREGNVYCCERCADETGCRCEEILRLSKPVVKKAPRRTFVMPTKFVSARRVGRPLKAAPEAQPLAHV